MLGADEASRADVLQREDPCLDDFGLPRDIICKYFCSLAPISTASRCGRAMPCITFSEPEASAAGKTVAPNGSEDALVA